MAFLETVCCIFAGNSTRNASQDDSTYRPSYYILNCYLDIIRVLVTNATSNEGERLVLVTSKAVQCHV